MRDTWQSYSLDLINYQNKCRLIRGWDELFNTVKEHINSVAAMKLSPYYKVNINYFINLVKYYYNTQHLYHIRFVYYVSVIQIVFLKLVFDVHY